MAAIRAELFARHERLTSRAAYLSAVAVIGSFATAVIFAVALAVSRDLDVAAVAALPAVAVIVAGAWAAVAAVRSRATGRRIALFGDGDDEADAPLGSDVAGEASA